MLNRCGGNSSRAAADLGIQRNTLKKYLRLQ
ncbi:MAG: helix-turn-helix domain-containing protein [Akkermansia sp.]